METGDFMFDAVLYAVKIVASFTSYSANIYNEVWWALNMYFVSNSLGMFLLRIGKIE